MCVDAQGFDFPEVHVHNHASKPVRVCQELTTLWVARLNDGAELKVTDPKEQQGDVEEEEAEG